MNLANYIKNFVLDSKRELIQIFIIVFCAFVPSIIDLAGVIKTLIGDGNPTIENAKYYYLMTSGNYVMGGLFAIYVLVKYIRIYNKERIFNKGNIYHDKPYWWYCFCSTILGYEKCNLILVPIYTQYRLILRDTFDEYPFEESAFPDRECAISVEKNLNEENTKSKDINLVIQDTYPILDNQIPDVLKSNNTIVIRRHLSRLGERVYSKELVDSIVEEIRGLDNDITLNIFSTTNPKNTYEIVKKAIYLAERGNVKHVNVFQQRADGNREFINKPHKVM